MGVSQEAYVDPVLPDEVIKFQLPAMDTLGVGVSAGEQQGFSPFPSRPCCHTQLLRGQRL
jgi:hypothetical protein